MSLALQREAYNVHEKLHDILALLHSQLNMIKGVNYFY
jgi:hypothetical protein